MKRSRPQPGLKRKWKRKDSPWSYLQLAQEFREHEKAPEDLVEVLEKRQTLKEHNAAMEWQGKERQQSLQTQIDQAEITLGQRKAEIKSLDVVREDLESNIKKLKGDQQYETAKEKFYRKYFRISPLLDCLASWGQVYFMRCNSTVSNFTQFFNPAMKPARLWTDRPPQKCPHCGLSSLLYDETVYRAIGASPGAPITIVPEDHDG